MERFAIKIDKNLRANLYKICRLCGIDNPDKVKVLDDETIVNLEEGEPELWKKVLDCIGLLITKDDKMPQFMCTLCVDKINDFFEFREMCYATDGQTRKLLGIKEEPKLKISPKASSSSVECKTEDQDIKQPVQVPVISAQRSGRKRRNADMEICNTSNEIKTDETDDVKPTTSNTNTSFSKKKRIKIDNIETDTKLVSGSTSKTESGLKETSAKLALSKRRLKLEPVISKEKKDVKPAKMSKLMKKKLKVEASPPGEQEEQKPLSLQMQKKKKALEMLKQRKLAKKVAVVKVEKLRKGSVESKIKEETAVPAPAPAPTQPKVKLKDKCTICDEGFLNKALLDKHIKITHIPTVVRYHCVQCNETLKKNMEIKNHNLWHKLSKTPFQCGNCSESSCSIYTYSKHIRDCGQVAYLDAHIPDWHCPECRGVFETTYLFNIHSCVSNTLVCPGCDRSHKWKEDYFKHIPTCTAAVHRIPPYMSSNIQVKNEAEHPTSPIPPHNAQSLSSTANITVQPTPSSRITPPLMDSNQCVVIPGNVTLLDEASSPSSKSSGRKSKRITKKDLKRFDKLLKSTMTTLVSIKHEPTQGESGGDDEQSISSDVRAASPSPSGSPAPPDDDFHHNEDDDNSADEQTSQPVGMIKQEIIDEGYRDLYNNIEVNIKRELELNEAEVATLKKTGDEVVAPAVPMAPKPVLKLKITKEHGTLNSILLDSPKSEKKKKKKRKKEEKLKAAEKGETNVVRDVKADVSNVPKTSDALVIPDGLAIPNASESLEEEPAMPLPEIICIKKEVTELEEDEENKEQLSSQSRHSTPSIVAATSGSLQISCVSEGVHFNGAEDLEQGQEISEQAQEELEREGDVIIEPAACEEIDIKPCLEDLIPMLQIASVSSGEDLIKKPVETTAKRKRRQTTVSAVKSSISTPQIVSVSSGSEVLAYHSEPAKASEDGEETYEKVDNNENVFDYNQVRIKEEVVDPAYGEQDCEIPAEDEEVDEEEEQKVEKEVESTIREKEAEENAYIANIDFNNLTIKQEKEYIDDGLDNPADDVSSDTDSESSSDTEDSDSESEREYRDLPSEDDQCPSETLDAPSVTAPLGLQISAVHSEFSCPQTDEKTESQLGAILRSEDKTKSNRTTECGNLESEEQIETCLGESKKREETLVSNLSGESSGNSEQEVETQLVEHRKMVETPGSNSAGEGSGISKEYSNIPVEVGGGVDEPKDNKLKRIELTTTSSVQSVRENANLSSNHANNHSAFTGSIVKGTNLGDDIVENPCSVSTADGEMLLHYMAETNHCVTINNTLEDQLQPSVISQDLGDISASDIESRLTPLNDFDWSFNLKTNEPSTSAVSSGIKSSTSTILQEFGNISPHDKETNPLIFPVSTAATDNNTVNLETSFEANVTETIQDADEINIISQSVGVFSTTDIDMRRIDASYPPKDNREGSTTQEISAAPIHLMKSRTASLAEISSINISGTAETKVINRLVNPIPSSTIEQYDDDIMSDTEPVVNDPGPSPSMTQDTAVIPSSETMSTLLRFPDAIATTSHSTIDQTVSTKTYNVEDLTTINAGGSLKRQASDAHASNNMAISSPLSTVLLSSSVQSVIGCQSPSPLSNTFSHSIEDQKSMKSSDNYRVLDDLKQTNPAGGSHSYFNEIEQQNISIQPPTVQCLDEPSTLPIVFQDTTQNKGVHLSTVPQVPPFTSSIALESTIHHTDASAIQNTNEMSISIDLSDVLSNSTLQVPIEVLSTEPIRESSSNISAYSTDRERFTSESSYVHANLNLTELCRNTTSLGNLPEFQVDLTAPTAGQLHTFITPTDVHRPLISELSVMSSNSLNSDTDLSVPVLSEEVQNLLNEDTVAASNFVRNDNILRARCSTSTSVYSPPAPVAVSVANFTDLENVNEIAENNNNANIERELQDELGNVLAAAIANRSPNDEADDNNVMNENRANFDVT